MGSSKSKKQVVGHKYYRSMDLGLCHGLVDAIRSITIKDKVAWSGNIRATENGTTVMGYIDQTGLFGGDDLEGGVQGYFEFGFGGFNQQIKGVNPDGGTSVAPLQALGIASPWMPTMGTNYRGIAVLNLHDFYWGTNPYLPDVAVEVERYSTDWFPELAQIGIDSNPAHIIYECITNDQWGLGYSADEIDDDAMRVAAGVLYNESLGLSMTWSEQQSIEDFIGTILPQVDGSFYFNPSSGKWALKLVRSGDPVVHRLDPSNFKLSSFTRRSLGETVNELTVRYVSPETEEFVALTIQDSANVMATGQTIPGSKNYQGVRSEALASRLGLRDLVALSSTLAGCDGTANRDAWFLNPGDLIEFTWPAHDIALLRMRVSSKTISQLTNDIKLTLIEDVFGQDLAAFNGTQTPGWQDTRQPPGQYDVLVPFELPFWFVYQSTAGVIPNVDTTFAGVLPVSANTNIVQANLFALKTTVTAAEYELVDADNATPSALLSAALVREVTSTATVLASSVTGANRISVDSYAVIGDGVDAEMVRVIGSMAATGFTLERGIMDTQPKAWPQGTRIYFIGEANFPADPTPRSVADVVDYKVTMQTSSGQTTIDEVPVTVALLEGRQGRPYPVANVTINGVYWPAAVTGTGAIPVTWSTRNRLLQNGTVQVRWDEGSIVPEDGQTVLIFTMQNGAVVTSVQVTDPAVNSANLPIDGLVSGPVEIHVRTTRDVYDNYQDFVHTIQFTAPSTGFGQAWGI